MLSKTMDIAAERRERPSESRSAEHFSPSDWIYRSAAVTALEVKRLFRDSWQFVAHICQVPLPGDYVTLDAPGIRVVVVRGADDVLRAFNNVCSHRGFRLFQGEAGNAGHVVTCKYHSWCYGTTGSLRGIPDWSRDYPHATKEKHSLTELKMEIVFGLIFVRMSGERPPPSEVLAPFAKDLAHYRIEAMIPLSQSVDRMEVAADWKLIVENDLDKDHLATIHPALTALVGTDLSEEVASTGAWRSIIRFLGTKSKHWNINRYQALLQDLTLLPPHLQQAAINHSIFPNLSIYAFPDRIDVLQMFPMGPGRTLTLSRTYIQAEDSRQLRALRFLSNRIEDDIFKEDLSLLEAAQSSIDAGVYIRGPFSATQIGIHNFYSMLYERLPLLRLPEEPSADVLR